MTSDERGAASLAGSQPANGNGATDPDRLDLLDRYWDAVTGNGYQRAESIALDPTRARTVDLLQTHAHEQTAGIPDAARARIWRETVAAAGIRIQQEPPMVPSSTPLSGSGLAAPGPTLPTSNPPNRRRPGVPALPGNGNRSGRWSVPGGAGPSQPTGRAWWPRLQFAVAAVLILGLFATILAPMDDGRVGLFGGIGNNGAPAPAASVGPVDVSLPATNRGHTVTIDRLTIPESQRLVLEPGSFRLATAESGGFSVAEVGEGLAYVDDGGMIPIGLYGGHITAMAGGPATIQLVTIAAVGSRDQSIPEDMTRERLASFDTTAFAGQSQAEGLLTSPTTTSYFEQLVPLGIEGNDLFRSGTTQAFVYAEHGTTQISSPGIQARLIPNATGTPGDFSNSIDLTTGDAAIVGDASTAGIRSVAGADDGTVTALILAPTEPTVSTVTSNSATPFVDPALGQTGQVSLEIAPRTTQGIIALERVTVAPGRSWVVPDGNATIAVWAAGSATQVQDGATIRTPTDPLRYPNVATLEPGTTITALGPEPVIFDRAMLYPTLTPPSPVTSLGVTVTPLGYTQIQNIANATSVDLFLREDMTGSEPESPFLIEDGVTTDQSLGVFSVLSGTLDATGDGSLFPSATGGQASAARVEAGESIRTNTLDGIMVATASGETTPATFVSAFATLLFEAEPMTSDATPTATTILDTTVDASAANPFIVSVEQHIMGPDASFLFRFGDAPGGTIVSWVAVGSARLTMDGEDPVEISAGSPDTSISELAATGDLRIIPGPEGATIYHAQIGIPSPLGGMGGSEGSGTLAVNYVGSWSDAGYNAPSILPTGAGAQVRIALTLGTTGTGETRFDQTSSAVLISPVDGPVHLASPSGPVIVSRIVSGSSPDQSLPPDVTPGQGIVGAPTSAFSVDVSGTPATYLALQISPAEPADLAEVSSATPITSELNAPTAYTGGGGVLEIPASDEGHLISIDRLTIPAGRTQNLPPGASYIIQSQRGGPTIERNDGSPPVNVSDETTRMVGLAGGRIVSGDEQAVVTILSISPTIDRPFWVMADSGGGNAPLTLYETTGLIGTTEANVVFGRGPVPTSPEAIPPLGTGGVPDGLTDPATILIYAAERSATTITSTGPLLENVGQGTTPSEPVASLIVETGNTAVVRNPAEATFQQARQDESAVYTSVFIAPISPEAMEGTPMGAAPPDRTPVSGTPAAGTDIPACDITPRTVEERLTLYDEGVVNPVDPLALSHRDELGTGIPADDQTIAAVTDTLLRQSACQTLNDPLRQHALYSDQALRYALPLIYETRDDVASLPEQPAAQASAAASGSVSISDVELFADGRVGARVSLESEFAYVTFTRAADGRWLIDGWDDRDEPGV